MTTQRNLALSAALAVAVAAFAAVSVPQTKELTLADSCIHMTWPAIPAACLIGGADRPVRMISPDRVDATTMAERFTIAFD
jgi:hypothetical protein